jgi:hypothetical protein
MIDIWDANARALIAFSLVLIAGLLAYIAFRDKPQITRNSHSRKK